MLTNCIYAPDLNYNLISTLQLIKKNVNTYLQSAEIASELIHEEKILDYTDMHLKQYILRVKQETDLATKETVKSTKDIKL